MSAESGKFKVYTRDNIPMEWRLNNTDRFGPILVVAESQYAFKDQFGLAEWVEQTYKKPGKGFIIIPEMVIQIFSH